MMPPPPVLVHESPAVPRVASDDEARADTSGHSRMRPWTPPVHAGELERAPAQRGAEARAEHSQRAAAGRRSDDVSAFVEPSAAELLERVSLVVGDWVATLTSGDAIAFSVTLYGPSGARQRAIDRARIDSPRRRSRQSLQWPTGQTRNPR